MFAVLVLFLAATFGSVRAQAKDDHAKLVQESQETLATFKRTDPGMATFLERAAGYVVFPNVGKGGAGVGGAHGNGVLFDRAGRPLGKASLNQLTVGLQLGGQVYSEVLVFETPKALADFQTGRFELAAQASAVALKSGASANARFQNGVAVFTAAKGGLMYEASVGGQKFSFAPFAHPVK
jgi:lipid-binding SYLF domain-containing protein